MLWKITTPKVLYHSKSNAYSRSLINKNCGHNFLLNEKRFLQFYCATSSYKFHLVFQTSVFLDKYLIFCSRTLFTESKGNDRKNLLLRKSQLKRICNEREWWIIGTHILEVFCKNESKPLCKKCTDTNIFCSVFLCSYWRGVFRHLRWSLLRK